MQDFLTYAALLTLVLGVLLLSFQFISGITSRHTYPIDRLEIDLGEPGLSDVMKSIELLWIEAQFIEE